MADEVEQTYRLTGKDDGASGVFGKVADAAEKAGTRVGGALSKLGETIGGDFGDILSKVGDGIERVSQDGQANLGKITLAAGGVTTAIGAGLMELGSGNEQATAQLKQAVENAGQSWEQYEDRIAGAIEANENLAVSDDETQAALQILVQQSNDTGKSLGDMTLVTDLAAAKHISLSAAAEMVAKIHEGKGAKALQSFGIELTKNKDGTVNSAAALGELAQKVDGQAATSVDNFSGKVAIMRTQLGDWAADQASKYGPAVTAFGAGLTGLGAAMEIAKTAQNAGMLVTVKDTIVKGAHTVATTAQTVASGAATAAQWLWNAALSANPIALVIIAIVALVAGLIWFFTQTETGRKIVSTAMDGIRVAFGWVSDKASSFFTWVRSNWPLLLAILTGPIGLAVLAITKHWDTIVQGVRNAKSKITTAASGMFDGIRSAFKTVINFVASGWNRLSFSIPGFSFAGVNVPGFTLSVPKIPMLAQGGIVTSPTLAILGEAGPEAVVPLDGQGIGGNIYVTVEAGAVGDEDFLARTVRDVVQRVQNRGYGYGPA